MEQNKVQATTGITFRILVALSICHCLNDTLQSVISAVYPLFKEDLGLSFAQIGLITLVYQSAASVCQPLTGLFFDKWPSAWSLPTGMSFTLVGLLSLAFANTLPLVLCSVALVGIGSSVRSVRLVIQNCTFPPCALTSPMPFRKYRCLLATSMGIGFNALYITTPENRLAGTMLLLAPVIFLP